MTVNSWIDWPGLLAWAVPLAALIVSVSALVLSVWSGLFTRFNARISALPLLHPFQQTTGRPQNGAVHVEIVAKVINGGLGPAVITKYEVFANGALVNLSNNQQTTSLLVTAFGLSPQKSAIAYFWQEGAIALPKDGTLNCLSLESWVQTQGEYDRVVQHLQHFCIRIEYESLYGDEFLFDSRVPALRPKLRLISRLKRQT